MSNKLTVVHTDGSCLGNPGPGGWAWASSKECFASGPARRSTNQRMELTAAFKASKAFPGPLVIVSDSSYVVNCFTKNWWKGWRSRGWVTSAGKPVANRDLWEPFIELVAARTNIEFRWVKGHSGDIMNDFVDRLAVQAATSQTEYCKP